MERAQMELLCALVSLSSYDDELNLVVRRRLQEMGWVYEPFAEKSRAANTNVFLVHREIPGTGEQIYILAIRGTSSAKDAEVDLRIHRVPFGGSTPEEFLAFAARKDLDASHPLVHQGFHDYAYTALFRHPLQEGGETLGERIVGELRGDAKKKLILTGHSLGGAVAVLSAARFADMGIPSEQIEVITFGAPAVGNASFARRYETRFPLSRIVIGGDPIKSVLQSIHGGYVQFGQRIDRKQNPNSVRFAHDMVVYLDDALRNFYDVRQNQDDGLTRHYLETRPAVAAKIYVPPMRFFLDEGIANDESYMREAVKDAIRGHIAQPVFAEEGGSSLLAICEAGKRAGCDYVLLEEFRGARVRQERNVFQMVMEETLYDVEGHLLEGQSTSTTTRRMTPLEAAIYVQMAGRECREASLAPTRR